MRSIKKTYLLRLNYKFMVARSLNLAFSRFSQGNRLFWLGLSIAFTLAYSLLALKEGFSGEWIVQDDARQHVFWTLRYVDSELFPNDLIADYFQSVAPIGYKSLYYLVAKLGIHPLIFNKILPVGISVITTYYCFSLCQRIFSVPFACFLSSLILNQTIWIRDGIISGTPKAFAFPLLLAFLYYLSKHALIPSIVTIILLGAFYPQGIFLASGMLVLQLVRWKNRSLTAVSQDADNYYYGLIGLGVAVAIMLFYALHGSKFAPVITLEQARQLPEFSPQGRTAFFRKNWYEFYLFGGRAGMFPNSMLTPATNIFGFCLPLVYKFKQFFPLVSKIQPRIVILPQLLFVSIVMFIAAHILLFRLYLPSRYTGYSFIIIIALTTGIVLSVITDYLFNQLRANIFPKLVSFKLLIQKIATVAALVTITIAVFFYPSFLNTFPVTLYKRGATPNLYHFLQKQPKDILIASLAADSNNIPTFAQRSILVSSEYALPYHWGYYKLLRPRAVDLINAQYTNNPEELKQFINRYGIDFWIVENSSFTITYLENNRWLKQYQPATQKAIDRLKQNDTPILSNNNNCNVFEEHSLIVISTQCLLKQSFED